ncbi:MAG: FAD:protein FMN transferase [Clostridia bacterium]|nr:FAD:protein FMN transferase [Clostridia bacterium]
MKKVLLATLCAFIVILITAQMHNKVYSRTEYMLDTVITIKADDKKAVDACFDEITRLEKLLSAYLPDSDVSRINVSDAYEKVKVSPEVVHLIKKAATYKELTDGMFDISIKPVVDLWDIKNGGYVPDDSEIADALSLTGDVLVNAQDSTVSLAKDGMKIDLGGIAKGYVGDKVREILLSHGVDSAIADLGGNIVAVGKNGSKDWLIGLQNPTAQRGSTFAEINVDDKVVVTSGGYERYFEKDGIKYHHIIDPATGKNPDNDILSITVVSDDGTLADALSTACFVAGKDKAIDIAKQCGVDIIIYSAGDVYYTSGIKINN